MRYTKITVKQNPKELFDIFSQRVTRNIRQGKTTDPKAFSSELYKIGDMFEKQRKIPQMNNDAKRLAETLVSLNENNLSGIVYSFLIKFNQDNSKLIEQLAVKALAIAKRLKDPVHIVARILDIIKSCDRTQPQSFLKLLYEEKRALASIIKNYDNASKKYNSVSRQIKPKENYESMLVNVKIRIARTLKDKEPKIALIELKEALDMAVKLKNNEKIEIIEKFIAGIKV